MWALGARPFGDANSLLGRWTCRYLIRDEWSGRRLPKRRGFSEHQQWDWPTPVGCSLIFCWFPITTQDQLAVAQAEASTSRRDADSLLVRFLNQERGSGDSKTPAYCAFRIIIPCLLTHFLEIITAHAVGSLTHLNLCPLSTTISSRHTLPHHRLEPCTFGAGASEYRQCRDRPPPGVSRAKM